MTRVSSDELVEYARPADNFETWARPWEFWGAAKLGTGANDPTMIATMINWAIRRDMVILLTAFGDELFVSMPASISMPVPCRENIVGGGAKLNYLCVYVAPTRLLTQGSKTNPTGKQLSTRNLELRDFVNVLEEKGGNIRGYCDE